MKQKVLQSIALLLHLLCFWIFVSLNNWQAAIWCSSSLLWYALLLRSEINNMQFLSVLQSKLKEMQNDHHQ